MKKVKTRQGAAAMLATAAYLRPRLAQDATVNLVPIFADLTARNFNDKRDTILQRIKTACRGKLAQDSPLGEVAEILDMVRAHPGSEEEDELPEGMEEPVNKVGEEFAEPDSMDADPLHEVEEFLRDKLDDGDLQKVLEMLAGGEEDHAEGENQLEDLGAAHDNEEEEFNDAHTEGHDEGETPEQHRTDEHEWRRGSTSKPVTDRRHARDRGGRHGEDRGRRGGHDRRAHDEPPPFKGRPDVGGGMDSKNYVAKDEMQRSIRAAVDAANRTQREIREAERTVRPWVGELTMTFDSADEVYRRALKIMGVTGVDKIRETAALKTILEMQNKPNSQRQRSSSASGSGGSRQAADSSRGGGGNSSSFFARNPNAARIRVI